MNRSELIKEVASKTDLSVKEVTKVVDIFFQELSENLNTENISIKDFGTFKKTIREARTGRNPQTGQAIKIPEKEVVKFNPSKNILKMKWL